MLAVNTDRSDVSGRWGGWTGFLSSLSLNHLTKKEKLIWVLTIYLPLHMIPGEIKHLT